MQIGSDELRFREGHAFIYASRPMDWPIREFSRIPIMVLGSKYYLTRKSFDNIGERDVYELCPWPPECQGPSPSPVMYNEFYVRERDRSARVARGQDALRLMLYPLYPVLGLFWSRFKSRHLWDLGFEPRSITDASVIMTFLFVIAEGVFVGWLAGGIFAWLAGWPRVVDWAILAVLATDCTIRFSNTIELDQRRHLGFLEWIFNRGE